MICQKCGSQLNMDGTCPNCGQGNVRIMEKSEINAYDGITIEENSYEQENARTEKNDSSFGGFGGFGGSDRGPRIIRFSSLSMLSAHDYIRKNRAWQQKILAFGLFS